jgi:hypothetical protein
MKIIGSETKGVTKISSYANTLREATIVRGREYL